MRMPSVSWTQTAEGMRECAWQAFYCGLSVCEKFAAAQSVLAQPYPHLDVVIAAPSFASQRLKKAYEYNGESSNVLRPPITRILA
ncbi:hypothetical protein B5X24_HaOG203221 [Helicoverpa armigera]|uniref:Uncharacterized protein n=1 Tax=Helicoverpa armigera TaxID=29058 RepID=A0A2W1BR45_HELAM|nr:hypothetical protein B5X24_HaOG203221 [Helicoverpa armigera]